MPAAFVGIAGAAISAGTAIAGAVSGGSQQSSDISTGQQQATAAEQAAYGQYSSNEAPYLGAGTNALSSLSDADGLNGATGTANTLASFQGSPGYQYQLSQGLSAIDNGAAHLGTLRSGNTLRAEETLGSNLANQDFGTYVSRLNQLATLGQSATSGLGQAGLSAAGSIASTDTSAATAQANIAGNTASSVGKAVSGLASNPGVQNALAGATASSSNWGDATT